MKNIHILPTDKPSRIRIGDNRNFVIGSIQTTIVSRNNSFTNQHIYITSDEEIKVGDWFIDIFNVIHQTTQSTVVLNTYKKIILTTDQDLIKDGVQAIDDEFLEWFVKNPSCEEVEVNILWNDDENFTHDSYEIIIPQEEPKPHSFCETPEEKCTMNYCDENGCQNRKRELVEPKQETLEEAAERLTYNDTLGWENILAMESFKLGANWQQEQDKNKYSEEEALNLIIECSKWLLPQTDEDLSKIKQWFDKVKKN